MTVDQARAAVQSAFAAPLQFAHGNASWSAVADEFGATVDADASVRAALAASPGSTVHAVVSVKRKLVRAYTAYMNSLFAEAPRNATLRLVKLRPHITGAHRGLQVLGGTLSAAIFQALRSGDREPIALPVKVLEPKVTRKQLAGPIIVIRRSSNRLYLYRGQRNWRRFGVATGQAAYPTPLGRFSIVQKQRDPWWYPPPSPWAEGEKPVPPGPGNPLGTRWMGLSAPEVGIHGSPDAASIGYSASHGCIRMHIPDAEWLFDHVKLGTPVFIVAA
jgi:lipoprotein-anchoring transpeptidase ErfK/SrfK